MKVTLSSRDLPPDATNRARVELLHEHHEAAFHKTDLAYSDEPPLSWHLEAVPLGGSFVFGGISTVGGSRRTARGIAFDGQDSAGFAINRSAHMWYLQQGRHMIEVAPGAAVLLAQHRPHNLTFDHSPHSFVITGWLCPPAVLREVLGPTDSVAGRVVPASSPALALIRNSIDGLLASGDSADPSLLQAAEHHLADLVGLAVGANRATALEQISERGLKAARQAAVLKSIERHFTHPGFTAETVANELGISERQVHRLLEETPKTFYEHVLEYRLQRALRMLSDPTFDGLKVTQIARDTGFADVTHFNHAFRARFGDTPTGVRNGAATDRTLRFLKRRLADK